MSAIVVCMYHFKLVDHRHVVAAPLLNRVCFLLQQAMGKNPVLFYLAMLVLITPNFLHFTCLSILYPRCNKIQQIRMSVQVPGFR